VSWLAASFPYTTSLRFTELTCTFCPKIRAAIQPSDEISQGCSSASADPQGPSPLLADAVEKFGLMSASSSLGSLFRMSSDRLGARHLFDSGLRALKFGFGADRLQHWHFSVAGRGVCGLEYLRGGHCTEPAKRRCGQSSGAPLSSILKGSR
jgi:hypothetical protein